MLMSSPIATTPQHASKRRILSPLHASAVNSQRREIVSAPRRNPYVPGPAKTNSGVYTFRMIRAFQTALLLALGCLSSLAARAQLQNPPFPPGVVIPTVATVQNPQQTYALYV